MIIQRGIVHCAKLRKLEAISGNPAAIKWLIALWGYCEQNKACTRYPGMTPERLADACDEAIVDGAKLLSFLVASRWLEMDGNTVVVRKFEAYNSGLLQRIEASEKSARIRAEKAGKTYIPPVNRSAYDRSATGERPLSDRQPKKERKKEVRARRVALAVGREEKKTRTLFLQSETVQSPNAQNPGPNSSEPYPGFYDRGSANLPAKSDQAAVYKKFAGSLKKLADQLKAE